MQLVIANKAFSSWSMRPWLMMRALNIEFEEIIIPLRQPDTEKKIKAYSPAGKVPILLDGEKVVWESLAILHYLADRFPELHVWPSDQKARAHAYAIASEMHSGFMALRQACPMNLIKEIAPNEFSDEVYGNVRRIEQIWQMARARFRTSDKSFLFGAFSAADAMYAPVVCRLDTYQIDVSDEARAYMDAILSFVPFQEWRAAALKETWDITEYEDGHTILKDYRHLSPAQS